MNKRSYSQCVLCLILAWFICVYSAFAWKSFEDEKIFAEIYNKYEVTGQFEKALDNTNYLINQYINDTETIRFMVPVKVKLLLKLNRFTEAEETALLNEKLFGINLSTADGFRRKVGQYDLLVSIYTTWGKWETALSTHFKRASLCEQSTKPVDMKETEWGMWRNINSNQWRREEVGNIYFHLERFDKARDEFQRALAMYINTLSETTDNPPAYALHTYKIQVDLPQKIGYCLLKSGHRQESFKIWKNVDAYLVDSTNIRFFQQNDVHFLPLLQKAQRDIESQLK